MRQTSRTFFRGISPSPFGVALALGVFLLGTSRTASGGAADPVKEDVVLSVELDMDGELKKDDIKFGHFPEGRVCAFTYRGVKNPKDIAYYTKLGFRTTVGVSSSTSADRIKALEDAGAEIYVAKMWGAKAHAHGDMIGANTIQEAYDVSGTTRLVLRKHSKGQVNLVNGSSKTQGLSYWYRRNPRGYGEGRGFVHCFQDCNYLANMGYSGAYPVVVQRGTSSKCLAVVPNSDIGVRGKVANELIFYQSLSNQFRGTLRRRQKGQVVTYTLPEGAKEKERKMIERLVGKWAKHPDIWHARTGEICSLAYVKHKSRVVDVKANGQGKVITLGVDSHTYPDFLVSPLPLQLPSSVTVKSARINGHDCKVTKRDKGVFVDVPIQAALRAGCAMSMKTAQPNMEIPGNMGITLTIKNTSKTTMEKASLQWILQGHPKMTITGGTGGTFNLPAGGEKTVQAQVKTEMGAYYGIRAIEARIKATVEGKPRQFLEGFEIVVAPRLRVEVEPKHQLPMIKGQVQPFLITIASGNSSKPGGSPSKFVSHKSGACKGTLSFQLPEGLEAVPPQQAFEVADCGIVRLQFEIKNNTWNKEIGWIKPVIKLEGEKEPTAIPYRGCPVVRDEEMIGYKPIDDKGLTLHANWDDPDTWSHKCSNPRNKRGISGVKLSQDGIKGYCIKTGSMAFFDPSKTVNYRQGTIMMWMKRDPAKRNENQVRPDPKKTWKSALSEGYGHGELLIGVEGSGQGHPNSKSGVGMRRWPGWGGKDGYLEARYLSMSNVVHYVQVPYENKKVWKWRHVALLWHMKDRRLEIYLDGELAGKADPGKDPWLASPWDPGHRTGGANAGLSFGSSDHGKKQYMLRDEVYVYNRALTLDDIKANMGLVKKPATAEKPEEKKE